MGNGVGLDGERGRTRWGTGSDWGRMGSDWGRTGSDWMGNGVGLGA